MDLKLLVGSGDKVILFVLPFLAIGLILNVAYPAFFEVGGPPDALRAVSIVLSIAGVVIWLWAAALVATKVPRGELITNGPFALVKHPIYTGVALLVIPFLGFLLNSWLGIVVGAAMYIGSRRFAPAEEERMSQEFGPAWDQYCRAVKIPWL